MDCRKRFLIVAALALIALALALAACGGSDNGSSSSGGSSASTTSANTIPDLRGVELSAWIPPVLTKAERDQFKRFEQLTGAKINLRVFPLPVEQNLLAK